VDRAFQRAMKILETHRDALADGAARLLEKETLTGDELPVLDGRPIPE
jgi:ATP-dependent Zn protease